MYVKYEIAIVVKRKHLIVFHKASEINSKEMLYSYGGVFADVIGV